MSQKVVSMAFLKKQYFSCLLENGKVYEIALPWRLRDSEAAILKLLTVDTNNNHRVNSHFRLQGYSKLIPGTMWIDNQKGQVIIASSGFSSLYRDFEITMSTKMLKEAIALSLLQ